MKRTPLERSGKPISRRAAMKRANRRRKARLYAEQFGDHAAVIRSLPCDTCGAPPPSDPSHAKSRGAGGTKRHLWPQCRKCHRLYEDGHGPTKEYAMERAAHYWKLYGDSDV